MQAQRYRPLIRNTGIVVMAGLAVALAGALRPAAAVPAQQTPRKPVAAHSEVATLAAGCFWSMQAIFEQLKGVKKVVPGYAGGTVANPSYEQVETSTTGHAETVDITFDPTVISYGDLLRVMLTVRNPTTLNKQGNDEGPQYRSVIFYRSAEQGKVARQMIGWAGHLWSDPIVTEVTPYKNFYTAEKYHNDYYWHHPDEPYCKYVIAPEISEFRTKFKSMLKA